MMTQEYKFKKSKFKKYKTINKKLYRTELTSLSKLDSWSTLDKKFIIERFVDALQSLFWNDFEFQNKRC